MRDDADDRCVACTDTGWARVMRGGRAAVEPCWCSRGRQRVAQLQRARVRREERRRHRVRRTR